MDHGHKPEGKGKAKAKDSGKGRGRRTQWDSLIHADLKSPNVFLTTEHDFAVTSIPRIKVGDFGQCVQAGSEFAQARPTGTPKHHAPEQLELPPDTKEFHDGLYSQEFDITTAVDVWACGRTMHSLMHINMERDVVDIAWADLKRTSPKISNECKALYPSAMTDLVMRCLQPKPLDRISSQDLYNGVAAEVQKFKGLFQRHGNGREGSSTGDNAADDAEAGSRMLLHNELRYGKGRNAEWL